MIQGKYNIAVLSSAWRVAGEEAAALESLDKSVATVWHAAPPNALFVVASLGGDTAYTRWLFEIKTKRQAQQAGHTAWTPACQAFFTECSDRAVQGCLWLAVKP